MTDKNRKTFEVLSGLILGVPIGILPLIIVPGWFCVEPPISSGTGYAIGGICGIIAGFFAGHVYGPRYYASYMIGLSIAAIGGMAMICSVLSQVNAIPKIGYFVVAAIGAAPGLFLCRILRKVQDAVYPPSAEELARHKRIDTARKREANEQWRSSSHLKEKLEYRFTVIILFVLALIPPVGFLASLLVYSGNSESGGYGRRVAVLGMGLSLIVFAFYVGIYFYLQSLDPNNQMANAVNIPAPVVQALPANGNNNLPPPPPPPPDQKMKQPQNGEERQVAEMPARNNEPQEANPAVPANPPAAPARADNPPPDAMKMQQAVAAMFQGAKPKAAADDLNSLVDKLQHGDWAAQGDAVDGLLNVDPKTATKETVKAVAQGMKRLAFDQSTNSFAREKAIAGMAKWGGSFSVPLIIELLGEHDLRFHEACYRALAELKDPRAIEPAARDYMTELGGDAAGKCLEIFGADAEVAVLKYFPGDTPLFTKRGIEFLGKYGTRKSMKALESLRRRDDFVIYANDALRAYQMIDRREKEKLKKK